MAHACSGAGHQYGGSGQYKSHHGGRPTRVSLVSQMSQMSDVQLQAYNDNMQEIKEEEEKDKIVNNTSWLRQMTGNHKQENEDEFDFDFELPVIEEAELRKRCSSHSFPIEQTVFNSVFTHIDDILVF